MKNWHTIQLTANEVALVKKHQSTRLYQSQDRGDNLLMFFATKPKSTLVPDIAKAIGKPADVVMKRFGFITAEEAAALKELNKASGKERAQRTRLVNRLQELFAQAEKMNIDVTQFLNKDAA